MKNNRKVLYAIPIMILGIFLVMSFIPNVPIPTENSVDGINYKGMVCTSVIRADGTVEDNGCNHNVLYTTGAEYVETQLKTGSTDAVDWIALCDATNATCVTQTAGSSEPYTSWTDSGLEKAAGAVLDNGNGNWSVFTTFTASCDNLITNVTHLENDADLEFAGNEFTTVTLQTSDSLSINWTISVS